MAICLHISTSNKVLTTFFLYFLDRSKLTLTTLSLLDKSHLASRKKTFTVNNFHRGLNL